MAYLNAEWFKLSPIEKLQYHFAEQDFVSYVAGYTVRLANKLVRKVSYNLRVFKDIREFLDCLATNESLGRTKEANIMKQQFLDARESVGITEKEWATLVTILNKIQAPTIGCNIITKCDSSIFHYYFDRLDSSSLYKNLPLWEKVIGLLEESSNNS